MPTFKFPTPAEIVRLNRWHIERTGGRYEGPENLLREGGLGWVLDLIQHPIIFGADTPYPTLARKAAILAWKIIKEHIFNDGNKRTGMSALETFVRRNDGLFVATDEEIESMALRSPGPTLPVLRRNLSTG